MNLLAVAKPWDYWLAIPITALAVLTLVVWFFGYLRKVVGAKYPKQ